MVKQGYTKTDIGIIPEDWSIVSLKDLVSSPLSYGVNAAAVNYDSNLPQYIRITDITDDGRYDASNKVSVNVRDASNYVLSVGDILFARTGASTGKTYLYRESDGKLVYAGFLIKATVDVNSCDHRYIFWQFHTKRYYDWVLVTCTRSGQPGINGKEYSSYQIPIPPLNEQKEIANALSDIDTLVITLEKLIAKKKAIKQGAMQELLTVKRRLPGFDGEWNTMKVEEIVARFATGLNPRQNFKLNSGGINYYVTIKNFKEGILYLDDNCDRIDDAALNRINERSDLRKGDLLFSSIGRIGDAYLISETPTNWNINESVFALRPNIKVIDPLMLYWLLTSEETKRKLAESTTGSTLKSIKLGHLKEIELTFPADIGEQKAISTILYDMDAEIRELEKKLEKTRLIKQGMMSELLTGRIRLV